MTQDQIVVPSGLVITPETVANQSFTSAFRGYHPGEVRQFLKRVSDELAANADREVQLRRALQEALARAAHPELDEATVTRALGEHAAKLIASARETAASITQEAQKQGDAIVHDAEARVARMREEADGLMARRVDEADGAAASITRAAEAEAEAVRERVRAEAEAAAVDATREGKEMVAEARDVRERMLGDLSRRRRTAQLQVEQLLAARDRLLSAYDVVRRTVEQATAELRTAEPEARAAAHEVARRAEQQPGPEPRRELRAPPPPPAPAVPRLAPEVAPPPPPPPAAADRPPRRPQTVAGAAGDRMPALVLPPARVIPPAPVPPVAAPSEPAEPLSDLATGEVPVVTVDEPVTMVDELFARMRAEADPTEVDAPPAAAFASRAPVDPVTSENALEQRDGLLENLEAGLMRALKRVLQDEQNEVLDVLRRVGPASGTQVLPDLDVHTAGYSSAAVPWLQQAVRAGIGFVSDPSPEPDGALVAFDAQAESLPAVEAEALALAREVVEPLRERLSAALEGASDVDDPSDVAESLRAKYRQWKVHQVEEAARHHAVAAFAVGAFAATPDGTRLQWVVDNDHHCPDCDDNVLAGPTTKGEPFPTGQLHPPAHPGCRCLLLPAGPAGG